jgi:YVTN family beta-propeller protein
LSGDRGHLSNACPQSQRRSIALTPDGRTLFAANGPSNDVSIVDTATRKETGRVKVGTRPWGVVVVP